MTRQQTCGFLILDRKGEYIEDTLDQHGNQVFGLHHHPEAVRTMVVVSMRDEFAKMDESGQIVAYLNPQFSIRDIHPVDLKDFLPGLTAQQADLLRSYAYVSDFYDKLLAETQFGQVDKSHWYQDFPGLYELNDKGKQLVKKFEKSAAAEGREELTDEEREQLEATGSGGSKSGVLERAALHIKRYCMNPFFGSSARGRRILAAPSCVNQILGFLADGKFVFIDMRGQPDEQYTMVAAIFARRLLTVNKDRQDKEQIRACIVMEEAHNILSEEELTKGNGRGSVFIELAREGRSFKLGFVLVTQQPDANSIAPEVAKTIDSVVAFAMPPEDARHLRRLKPAFTDLELELANAREFAGVAVKDAGPVYFKSAPVDTVFMEACAAGRLDELVSGRGSTDATASRPPVQGSLLPTLEDRLGALMRQRQRYIQPVALETIRAWRQRSDTLGQEARSPS